MRMGFFFMMDKNFLLFLSSGYMVFGKRRPRKKGWVSTTLNKKLKRSRITISSINVGVF